MREIKFKWSACGKEHYRSVLIPDNARKRLFVSDAGAEVYSQDRVVIDGKIMQITDNPYCFDKYKHCFTINMHEHPPESSVYHEPLKLEEDDDACD